MSSNLVASSIYRDILKAPLFNSLLLFTMLSIHLGRAFFYFFTTTILIYFAIHFIRNLNTNWSLIKEIVLDLKHIAFSFLLILLAMTASNIANDITNIQAWIYELKFLLKIPVFLLILLFFHKKRLFSIKLFYCFLVCGLLLQGFDGLFQALKGYDFYRGTQTTLCQGLTGTTTNRNFFGYLVGFGIFIFIQLTFASKKPLHQFLSLLLGSMFFFCVLYSLSRGVWVAAIASLSFLFLYYLLTSSFQKSIFILTVLLLLLISIFTPDCLAIRSIAVVEGSSSARYPIWKEVVDLITQKPILGWGMEKMNLTGKFTSHAHNVLLEILLYTGLLGLSTFIFCIYNIMKDMIINKQIFLFSIIIYVIVRCFFDHTFFSGHLIPVTIAIIMFLNCNETLRLKNNAST